MTDPEIRRLLSDYLDKRVSRDVLESAMLGIGESEETELSRDVVGVLAESSHAEWSEEDLEDVLLPFVLGAVYNRPKQIVHGKPPAKSYQSTSSMRWLRTSPRQAALA